MPSYSRPITWPTLVCLAVTVAFGLLVALIGVDIPETADADSARARAIHERLHPPTLLVDDDPWPVTTGPVSAGVYMK